MSSDPKQELERKLEAYVGIETGPPAAAPEPVNESMIRHWCEAMGDANPAYAEETARETVHGRVVAPPTMLQGWTLRGIEMADPAKMRKNKQTELHELLSSYGYTSVVATNCDQTYARYLRPGDRITATTVIESISEEKATALGIGYFINTRDVYRDQHGEEVGSMLFRVLKFKPAQQPQAASGGGASATPAKPTRLKPPRGHDNAWWWDAVAKGELPIQRCKACGVLRHPPRPMCGACQSTEWDHVAAKGTGTVYSYTVLHHPKFPGYDYPLVCAVIELDEGTRIVSNVVGCAPADVAIGMRVEVVIEAVDGGLTLPLFRPASGAARKAG